jgi:hypothetical protein
MVFSEKTNVYFGSVQKKHQRVVICAIFLTCVYILSSWCEVGAHGMGYPLHQACRSGTELDQNLAGVTE